MGRRLIRMTALLLALAALTGGVTLHAQPSQAVNGAQSTLASGIAAGATSMTVATGEGARFPATTGGTYYVTIWNQTDYPAGYNDPAYDIVQVTSHTGGSDTFTISATTNAHNTGGKTYAVSMQWVAADFNKVRDFLKGPVPVVNATASDFNVSNSTTTTTGTITSGTASLAVSSATSFSVGQGIYVVGAGAAGAVLETTITAISGTTFTLAANASTTATTQAVGHSDTAGIQAALNYAASANVGASGEVYLPAGVFNVCGVDMPHEVWMRGAGQRSTYLKAIPGCTANGVVIIQGTTKAVGLFNMTIDGNKSASPAPTGSALYMTSTLTAGLRVHYIENVDLTNAVGDGFTMTTTGSNRIIAIFVRNVYAASNSGHGFNIATANVTDNVFVASSTGLNGLNGWNVLGGTNQFIGCGADDSGQVDATTYGDGWAFSGSGAVGNVISGGRAANNLRHSVYFTGTNKTNTVDLMSFEPRGDHSAVAGGTGNFIRIFGADPFGGTSVADSMANVTGGSGNIFDLTWPTTAIVPGNAAVVGSALESQTYTLNGVPRAMTVQIGSSDTVSASVVSTTETAFATTYTVPANWFTTKRGVRITVLYEITGTVSPTLILRGKIGGSTVYQSGTVAPTGAPRGGGLEMIAMGTAVPGASVNVETGVLSSTIWANTGHGNYTAQPVALATNGTLAITFTAQWSANTAGNSITLRQLIVEPLTGAVY